MKMAAIVAAAVITAGVLHTGESQGQGQGCLHGPGESVTQIERRQQAIGYMQRVNVEQARLKQRREAHVPLAEVVAAGNAPFGFVPRLTLDQWSYALILKDTLDPCGFVLFSDHEQVIYEAYPTAVPE